jgi:hypothetical protein
MRTYDDTFSGQRIYPGKVRLQGVFAAPRLGSASPIMIRSTVQSRFSCFPLIFTETTGTSWLIYSCLCRGSSTSAVTARSSASKTARPSPFSSSARTPDESHGRSSSEDSTRRVYQRLVYEQPHIGSLHRMGHNRSQRRHEADPPPTDRKWQRNAPAEPSSSSVASSVPRLM